ncbi:MAG: hypothetical protein K0U60_10950 [Actinomycetia bacterium]|nr:hypothetical protein [Actinomycetes bacterium]MCH9801939.1 hypothetical protein [Actinomycetes bacterium]
MRKFAIGAVAFAAALTFTACSSSEEEQTADANAQVCESLAGFNTTVDSAISGAESAASGEGQVTIGQAQDTANTIAEGWMSLKDALGERNEAVAQQVTTAVDKYQDTLKSISDDQDLSLAEAASQVATAQDTLESDLDAINSQLGC